MVKILASLLFVFAFSTRALPAQSAKPIPPGIREADQLPGPADVPPINRPSPDRALPGVMRDQARELAILAQTIPADVSQLTSGTLPKDLSEKLKRIEKLSKTLRSEVAR
jgi:hypothetical protein